MNYQTKFNIGDTVYFLQENKVVSGKVLKIDIVLTEKDRHEVCTVRLNGVQTSHPLHISYLFPTKPALLESL